MRILPQNFLKNQKGQALLLVLLVMSLVLTLVLSSVSKSVTDVEVSKYEDNSIRAFDAAQAEKILNMPKGYRIVTFFPVGVPEQPGKAPPRKELSEIVIKDKFSK